MPSSTDTPQAHKNIASIEELLQYTANLLQKTEEFKPVIFTGDDFTFTIRIEGESWDEFIDYRHAKYITAFQKTFNKAIEQLDFDSIPAEDCIVRFQVSNGSSLINIEFGEILKELAKNMTGTQSVIAVGIVVAGIAGYLIWAKYLETKQATEALTQHEQTKRELIQPLVSEYRENLPDYIFTEAPSRALANTLSSDDLISVGKDSVFISKKQFKQSLSKEEKSLEFTSYCDGDYLLIKKDYSLGELIFQMSKDGLPIKIFTSILSSEDQEKLANTIAQRELTEDMPFTLSLQVNVRHTDKKIEDGYIIGLGAPRSDKHKTPLTDLTTK